jgi:hypothetical protein
MVRTVSLNVRGNGTPTPWLEREHRPRIIGRSTDGVWEDSLVVEDILSPVHESINIFGRRKLCGAFVAHAIFPKVFVSSL